MSSSPQVGSLPPAPAGLCPVHLTFSTRTYCARKLLDGSDRCYFHAQNVAKYDTEVIKSHFIENITLAEALRREIVAGRSLEQAYLAEAPLAGNWFQKGCDLTDGIFLRANFSGAHLSYSVLDRADFALANLESARLGNCSISDVKLLEHQVVQRKVPKQQLF